MDFTNYIELKAPKCSEKTILTCTLRLDKKAMLAMLMCNVVFLLGKKYKVPEKKLLNHLMLEEYGETKLAFEEIK